MSAESRAAEVLAEHATIATGLREWACKCSPMEWRPSAHRATPVAAALAAAGCLADDREGETVTECAHGNPEARCWACAACRACDGGCGACPYAVTPNGGDQS